MTYESVTDFLSGNAPWAAGFAGAMLALTALAGKLLNPERKDEVALWLLGAVEDSWHATFTSLFDAVFGERHLSWKCLWRSALASLIAVSLIWLFMGNVGFIEARLQADLSLGLVLLLALGVNLGADYVSLLETRWLLEQMERFESIFVQALVLLTDLLISAAIIWTAIFLFVRSPLYSGEAESFAEILGVFSIFSVLFYSTFLTSVWTWAYVLTSWMMRLFVRLRIAHWLDVENKPVTVLGYVLAFVVFLGSLAVVTPFRQDVDGLTMADRTLCSLFKGPVCFEVAKLTETEQVQLDMILNACDSGLSLECAYHATEIIDTRATDARRLLEAACEGGHTAACSIAGIQSAGLKWSDGGQVDPSTARDLMEKGCTPDFPVACTLLGVFLLGQEGVADYPLARSALETACDAGDPDGCASLAFFFSGEPGTIHDPAEAHRLYGLSCNGGSETGCDNLGFDYLAGRGVERDLEKAKTMFEISCGLKSAFGCNMYGEALEQAWDGTMDKQAAQVHFLQACDLGSADACTNAGRLHQDAQDDSEAVTFYEKGCNGGSSEGCTWLGFAFQFGFGVDKDIAKAAKLYERGCTGGHAVGCGNLGIFYDDGAGVEEDSAEAHRLYSLACEGGDNGACINLGFLYELGKGVEADAEEAARLYQQTCEAGEPVGCRLLGILHERGLGVTKDLNAAEALFVQACDDNDQLSCDALQNLRSESD